MSEAHHMRWEPETQRCERLLRVRPQAVEKSDAPRSPGDGDSAVPRFAAGTSCGPAVTWAQRIRSMREARLCERLLVARRRGGEESGAPGGGNAGEPRISAGTWSGPVVARTHRTHSVVEAQLRQWFLLADRAGRS